MSRPAGQSRPVPGKILQSDFFMGLSFEQLLAVGSSPVIVMTGSLMVGFIPTWVGIAFSGLVLSSIVFIAARAPDGQSPFEWTPAAIRRRLTPARYHLKPVSGSRAKPVYLDVLHSVDESTGDPTATRSPTEGDAHMPTMETGGPPVELSSEVTVVELALEILSRGEISQDEKEARIRGILEYANEQGVSVSTEEIREAVRLTKSGVGREKAARVSVERAS